MSLIDLDMGFSAPAPAPIPVKAAPVINAAAAARNYILKPRVGECETGNSHEEAKAASKTWIMSAGTVIDGPELSGC
jgi:hypothetical protein